MFLRRRRPAFSVHLCLKNTVPCINMSFLLELLWCGGHMWLSLMRAGLGLRSVDGGDVWVCPLDVYGGPLGLQTTLDGGGVSDKLDLRLLLQGHLRLLVDHLDTEMTHNIEGRSKSPLLKHPLVCTNTPDWALLWIAHTYVQITFQLLKIKNLSVKQIPTETYNWCRK